MQDEPMPGRGNGEAVRPHVERMFQDILDFQCQKGRDKYRTDLETFNGRDALNDALAELVDAFQYVVQAKLENDQLRKELRLSGAECRELRKLDDEDDEDIGGIRDENRTPPVVDKASDLVLKPCIVCDESVWWPRLDFSPIHSHCKLCKK